MACKKPSLEDRLRAYLKRVAETGKLDSGESLVQGRSGHGVFLLSAAELLKDSGENSNGARSVLHKLRAESDFKEAAKATYWRCRETKPNNNHNKEKLDMKQQQQQQGEDGGNTSGGASSQSRSQVQTRTQNQAQVTSEAKAKDQGQFQTQTCQSNSQHQSGYQQVVRQAAPPSTAVVTPSAPSSDSVASSSQPTRAFVGAFGSFDASPSNHHHFGQTPNVFQQPAPINFHFQYTRFPPPRGPGPSFQVPPPSMGQPHPPAPRFSTNWSGQAQKGKGNLPFFGRSTMSQGNYQPSGFGTNSMFRWRGRKEEQPPEAKEEAEKMLQKKKEEISAVKKSLETKLKLMEKSKELSKKLSSAPATSSVAASLEEEEEASQSPGGGDDGAGERNGPESDSAAAGPDPSAADAEIGSYANYAVEIDKRLSELPQKVQKRVANTAQWRDPEWWRKKAREEVEMEARRKRRRSHSEGEADHGAKSRRKDPSTDDGPEAPDPSSSERRDEFRRLTEKMKAVILEKDPEYLDSLINGPSNLKRMMMASLVREHYQSVEDRLTRLRFSSGTAAVTARTLSAIDRMEREDLESQSRSLQQVVDLEDLPEAFVAQIESLVKTVELESGENQGEESTAREGSKSDEEAMKEGKEQHDDEEDADIVEVPVPPKPPAPVVTLDGDEEDEDEEEDATSAEPEEEPREDDLDCSSPAAGAQAVPVPEEEGASLEAAARTQRQRLLLVDEEERALMEELREYQEKTRVVLDRMAYLREFRSQILTEEREDEAAEGEE